MIFLTLIVKPYDLTSFVARLLRIDSHFIYTRSLTNDADSDSDEHLLSLLSRLLTHRYAGRKHSAIFKIYNHHFRIRNYQ